MLVSVTFVPEALLRIVPPVPLKADTLVLVPFRLSVPSLLTVKKLKLADAADHMSNVPPLLIVTVSGSSLFCWPAPNEVVKDATIAEILRPEPMPVEVTSELAVEADVFPDEDVEPVEVVVAVGVGVVVVVLEMAELMSLYVLSQVANLSAAVTQT